MPRQVHYNQVSIFDIRRIIAFVNINENENLRDMVKRRKTPAVSIGKVQLGSQHPIVIQSMTDTPTSDIPATLSQTKELIDAGAEMVRWTINDEKSAAAVPETIKRLRDSGYQAPIIGDFHFNGHQLLKKYSQTAKLLDKYRINPGNVGKGKQHDENFATFIRIAKEYDRPLRIGVNGGSIDPELLMILLNRNAKLKQPKSEHDIINQGMMESVLDSAQQARKLGLPKNRIILSAKMSRLSDLILVNQEIARRCDYALHLGLTEAGGQVAGITASAAALGILLNQGIGDTIRVSLTPLPGTSRCQEVEVCQALLQSLGLRYFSPQITSCPGCGRTSRAKFQLLASEITAHIQQQMPQWRERYPKIEHLTIAVMGCVVNGPGESRHADIGISLPGHSESAQAQVFVGGKQFAILKTGSIKDEFIKILEEYLSKRFSEYKHKSS
jgi:(E)-4-hydroxy-3-methylbut-2-enyl-diphosphate synthase